MTAPTLVPRETKARSARAPEVTAAMVPTQLLRIPLESIDIGDNVRVNVAELEELAQSIREHGVIQPIKVVATGSGRYNLVYGQRRVLASRIAGQDRILAIVELDHAELVQPGATRSIEQLVENLHRADLNPVDRARAMRAVVDAGLSQADLARKLGIAASTVSNDLRLLELDGEVLDQVVGGALSPSHAKAIAALPAKQQRELAAVVVRDKLSAHDLERQIAWKQDAATNDERRVAKTAKWIPKTIAALEAATVPQGAAVSIEGGYYDLDIEALKRAITAAGWKSAGPARYGYGGDRLPKSCDCIAVRIQVGGRKAEVERTCIDNAHIDREVNDRHVAETKQREHRQAELTELRNGLITTFVRANVPTPALQLLTFVLRRSGGGWSEWSQIPGAPGELIAAIANSMTQDWNLRDVPVGPISAALSVEP